MTARDIAWRGAGVALIALGCAPGIAMPRDGTAIRSVLVLIGLLSAMLGIVLAINGRRVGAVLRIERSRHRQLPLILNARRRSRSARR